MRLGFFVPFLAQFLFNVAVILAHHLFRESDELHPKDVADRLDELVDRFLDGRGVIAGDLGPEREWECDLDRTFAVVRVFDLDD